MKYNGAYYIFAFTLFILVLLQTLDHALANCNACHTGNPTACHNETAYSLCIDGIPTYDIIICPPNNVCTEKPNVCYPKETAKPFCERVGAGTRCGICDDSEQVFSCLNETTIAFCFGNSEPDYNAIAYCPDNSVCDLDNPEFCSEVDKAEPSCRDELFTTTSIDPTTTSITTSKPTATTQETTASISTTQEPITTTSTTPKPATTTQETTTTTSTSPKPTTTTQETTTTTSTTPKLTTSTQRTTTTASTTQKPTSTTQETTTSTTPKPTTTTQRTTTTTSTTPKLPTPTQKPATTKEPTITTTTKNPTTTTQKTTTTTQKPTTTTTEDPTTTTKKPRDPNTICREANKTGSFKADDDPTCTKYVLCYERNGTLSGLLRSCDPNLYFHESTALCQADKPVGCS